jgi:hypothetical protein
MNPNVPILRRQVAHDYPSTAQGAAFRVLSNGRYEDLLAQWHTNCLSFLLATERQSRGSWFLSPFGPGRWR